MIVAVDVVALWGLCAYGSRESAPLSRDMLPDEPPGVDVAASVHPRGRPARHLPRQETRIRVSLAGQRAVCVTA